MPKQPENLKPPTLLKRLDRTPPFVCRIMAIKTGPGVRPRRKTNEELSKLSGIPARTVVQLAYLPSWAGVKIETASRFAEACGVDLCAKNPMFKFFRSHSRGDANYLTKSQREACERARRSAK